MSAKRTIRYIMYRIETNRLDNAIHRLLRQEQKLNDRTEKFMCKYEDFLWGLRQQHPDLDNAFNGIGYENPQEETNTDEINDVFDI